MDDDEEDYIFFGTPLPEIEDEATLKKKAAKELQVRDEKGRQRFHGAFTGGFSAGYFNTVGTKEGWTPSTFISSRDKAADRIQQNPEDFMDDEDFGEFGIATRKIHTTTNFQDVPEKKRQKRKFIDTDDVIPGEAPLKDIVQPVRESIGILILKKLGWREGQGIGPRIKTISGGPKIYGCSPFPDTSVPEEEDPTSALFTFAPKDTESVSYMSKDNYFGLGYTGLSKEPILGVSFDPSAPTTTKSWLAKDKKKIKISGQAFGVGAFEDDDADIYGKDDMSQYDFSELELRKAQDSHKRIDTSRNENSQGILEGFHLAEQPPLTKKHYAAPALPPNYRPVHLKTVCSAPQKINQSRHSLSAPDRAFLLGERKFEKASLNDPFEQKKKSSFEQIQSVASSSTSSLKFQPFSNDIAKQKRYNEYLKLKQSEDISKFVQPASMTEWEKQQELEEFVKAAILFKPSSSALSSHFESRSSLSVEHDVMAALEKLKREKEEKQAAVKKCLVGTSNRKTFEWHPVSLLCKRMNVPNPYPNSDSSGTQNVFQSKSVFDHLTFTSEKLQDSGKSSYSVSSATSILPDKNEESNKNLPGEVQIRTSDDMSTKENITDVPSIAKDSLSEDKRPPIDFFKDIFENSSSDEDDMNEEKNEVSNQLASEKESFELKNLKDSSEKDTSPTNSVNKKITNEFSHKNDLNNTVIPNSSKESKKVGFGVFANLDLDALNQRKPSEKAAHTGVLESKNEVLKNSLSNFSDKESTEKQSKADDAYGPELPPNYSSTPIPVSSSSRNSLKKHGKSKSSHKHKHHKHKHKKKKKKTSRRYSSSSISSEEPDDIPPALIIEKIKKLQKRKTL